VIDDDNIIAGKQNYLNSESNNNCDIKNNPI